MIKTMEPARGDHGETHLHPELLKQVVTFILAGGKGERLYPLTRDRSKPSVPFGGNFRIIDFTLSNCINSGMRRIFLLTQYKASSLMRHVVSGWSFLQCGTRGVHPGPSAPR